MDTEPASSTEMDGMDNTRGERTHD